MTRLTILLAVWAFICIQISSGQLRSTCRCFPGSMLYYEHATCQIVPDPTQRTARNIRGVVRLRQRSCYWCKEATEVSVKITGLPTVSQSGPRQHGFHVHAQGDITGGCASAAGHFNPFNVNHGGPDSRVRHVGDLGNIRDNGSGRIEEYFVDEILSITGNIGILGRSIVLHALEDDLGLGGNAGSLTTGNAGARLACCVIGRATNSSWIQPSVPITRRRLTTRQYRPQRCSWYIRRLFPAFCGAWYMET